MSRKTLEWAGAAAVIALAAVVWIVVIATAKPDNWKPCSEAIQARYGAADFSVGSISWEKQGSVEVARGNFDNYLSGTNHTFECGVASGDVQWLDVN